MTQPITCEYCGCAARFHTSSTHVYAGKEYGPVWCCEKFPRCDAYVGAHPDGSPKGRLANAELRRAKMAAHAIFDPLWQDYALAYPDAKRSSGHLARTMRRRAYAWLADRMGLEFDDCHIGKFNMECCARAIRIITESGATPATVRAWAKSKQRSAA